MMNREFWNSGLGWDSVATIFAGEASTRTGELAENRSKIEDLQSRGVAQPGSAPALGAGGRWFESSRPDQISQ
jgi:hypothetical protein